VRLRQRWSEKSLRDWLGNQSQAWRMVGLQSQTRAVAGGYDWHNGAPETLRRSKATIGELKSRLSWGWLGRLAAVALAGAC